MTQITNCFTHPYYYLLSKLKINYVEASELFAAQSADEKDSYIWLKRISELTFSKAGAYDYSSGVLSGVYDTEKCGYTKLSEAIAIALGVPVIELYPEHFRNSPTEYLIYWHTKLKSLLENKPVRVSKKSKTIDSKIITAQQLTGASAEVTKAAILTPEIEAQYLASLEKGLHKNALMPTEEKRKLAAAARYNRKPNKGKSRVVSTEVGTNNLLDAKDIYADCRFPSLLVHLEQYVDRKVVLSSIVELEEEAARKGIGLSRTDFDHFLYNRAVYFSELDTGLPISRLDLLAAFLNKSADDLYREFYKDCPCEDFVNFLAASAAQGKYRNGRELMFIAAKNDLAVTPNDIRDFMDGSHACWTEDGEPSDTVKLVAFLVGKKPASLLKAINMRREADMQKGKVKSNIKRAKSSLTTANVGRVSENRTDIADSMRDRIARSNRIGAYRDNYDPE